MKQDYISFKKNKEALVLATTVVLNIEKKDFFILFLSTKNKLRFSPFQKINAKTND